MPSTVLLVEDDSAIRECLETILFEFGFNTRCATNGRAGYERMLENPRPDIVLLDMMMPGSDGSEFLQLARANPDVRGVPVVVFSASYTPPPDGVVACLRKPVSLDELISTIKRFAAAEDESRVA